MSVAAILLALASPPAGGCTTSLIGTPLRLPAHPPAVQRRLDQDIAIARAALAIAPDREDTHIWLGRRLDYAGRVCAAVEAFDAGLRAFPDSYKLYRFRARDLTRARRFVAAIADYDRALALMGDTPDTFEPDGLPNRLALTISTYRGNIVYYRAQTAFATGDYAAVVAGMARALALAPDFARDDMRVPTAYWTYLALRKLGRHADARAAIDAVPAGLTLIENDLYYEAVRIMQGRLRPADATAPDDSNVKFAVAMERRFAGDEAGARALLTDIVRENAQGHWPSEVELADPGRRR